MHRCTPNEPGCMHKPCALRPGSAHATPCHGPAPAVSWQVVSRVAGVSRHVAGVLHRVVALCRALLRALCCAYCSPGTLYRDPRRLVNYPRLRYKPVHCDTTGPQPTALYYDTIPQLPTSLTTVVHDTTPCIATQFPSHSSSPSHDAKFVS